MPVTNHHTLDGELLRETGPEEHATVERAHRWSAFFGLVLGLALLTGCWQPNRVEPTTRHIAQDTQREIPIEISEFQAIEVPTLLPGQERTGHEPSIERLPPAPRRLYEIQDILVEGENVWIVATGGVILRVDFEAKKAVVAYVTPESISCSKLVSPRPGVLMVLQSDYSIVELDPATGTSREVSPPLNTETAMSMSEVTDIASFGDGTLIIVERTTDFHENVMSYTHQLFELDIRTKVKRPLKRLESIGDSALYIHCAIGSPVFYLHWITSKRMQLSWGLAAYDRWDGTLLWTRAVGSTSNMVVSPSGVIVLDETSRPPLIDSSGSVLGTMQSGRTFAWLDSDHLLVTSYAGLDDLSVYRVSDQTSKEVGIIPIDADLMAYCHETRRIIVADRNCRIAYATVRTSFLTGGKH